MIFSTALNAKIAPSEKVIVFDFGGVIVHPDRTLFFEFIKNTFRVNDAVLKELQDKFKAACHAKIPESLFWKRMADELMIDLPTDWKAQYDAVALSSLNECQEMRQLIKSYKELGFRVALLSNVAAERAIFLRSKGYYDAFFPVLLSCEIGVSKPHPKAYQLLLDEVKVSPENCIFIDNKQVNIDAAKNLGIDAILFLNTKQIAEELEKRLQSVDCK